MRVLCSAVSLEGHVRPLLPIARASRGRPRRIASQPVRTYTSECARSPSSHCWPDPTFEEAFTFTERDPRLAELSLTESGTATFSHFIAPAKLPDHFGNTRGPARPTWDVRRPGGRDRQTQARRDSQLCQVEDELDKEPGSSSQLKPGLGAAERIAIISYSWLSRHDPNSRASHEKTERSASASLREAFARDELLDRFALLPAAAKLLGGVAERDDCQHLVLLRDPE
jgi:hypothetical protein